MRSLPHKTGKAKYIIRQSNNAKWTSLFTALARILRDADPNLDLSPVGRGRVPSTAGKFTQPAQAWLRARNPGEGATRSVNTPHPARISLHSIARRRLPAGERSIEAAGVARRARISHHASFETRPSAAPQDEENHSSCAGLTRLDPRIHTARPYSSAIFSRPRKRPLPRLGEAQALFRDHREEKSARGCKA